MSRAEYDAMVATGRVQPNLDGREMKHVTLPPNPNGFLSADAGSVFAEFNVDDQQVAPGGREDWFIIYGPNSPRGRNALNKGILVTELPTVDSLMITKVKQP